MILLAEKEFTLSLRVYSGAGEHSSWEIEMQNGHHYHAQLQSIPHYMLERFYDYQETIES